VSTSFKFLLITQFNFSARSTACSNGNMQHGAAVSERSEMCDGIDSEQLVLRRSQECRSVYTGENMCMAQCQEVMQRLKIVGLSPMTTVVPVGPAHQERK